MSLIEIIILAMVLGIDCLVVSFSQGLVLTSNRVRSSFFLALSMGIFQGLFPCLGYLGTSALSAFLEPFSHILVFAIFTALGVKFIKEAYEEKQDDICSINFKCLVGLGVATSIDAFASGITLQLTVTPLLISVLLIGLMSFTMSLCGFWSGNFFKHLPTKLLEIIAGIILIIMGVKAFF